MVTAYLVNGFSSPFLFNRSNNDIFTRENLTIVPAAIKYNAKVFDDTYVFINDAGASVSLQNMGTFSSEEEALKQYSHGGTAYDICYDNFKKTISPQKKDSEWNMLLLVSSQYEKPESSFNICKINNLDVSDYQTFIFIDACMIYQTLKIGQEFIKTIKINKTLSKLDSFLIGYYLDVINMVKEPEDFLINEKEIQYLTTFFELWDLASINANLTKSISSTIEIFDFIFRYESNKKNKLISLLFSILTVITGYTSLYVFFEEYNIVRIILTIFFSVVAFVIFVRATSLLVKSLIERRNYLQKISRKR